MANAKRILAQLYQQLGENKDMLRCLPLHKVVAEPLDDPDSVNFKILFGHLSATPSSQVKTKRSAEVPIWLHFYPATHPKASVQIHFIEHTKNGKIIKHDMQNISQNGPRLSDAFAAKDSIARDRAVILAKYYFLVQIANNPKNNDELLHHGMPMTKTFIGGLADTCVQFRSFQQAMGSDFTPNMIGAARGDSEESVLSSVPSDLTMEGATLHEATSSKDAEPIQTQHPKRQQPKQQLPQTPQPQQSQPKQPQPKSQQPWSEQPQPEQTKQPQPNRQPNHQQPDEPTDVTMEDSMMIMVQAAEDEDATSKEIATAKSEIAALDAEIARHHARRTALKNKVQTLELDQEGIRLLRNNTLSQFTREQVYEIGLVVGQSGKKRKREE